MRRIALVATLLVCVPAVAGTVTDLFISEYVEGTSNNKAFEIYNGTAAAVGLEDYSIWMVFNGTATDLRVDLHGTIAPGDVHVLAHSSASFPADQTSGGGWFNGNDAIVLRKNGVVIDSIGQRFVDPGEQWGSGLTSTADNTLRRKPSVCGGDTNPDDAFQPSLEWVGFATDTFIGLGSHTADCTAAQPPALLEIFQIQGDGDASTRIGERVTTRGVVTAIGPQGFFLQTPSSSADSSNATSNGIYVFTSTKPILFTGDILDVTGTVAEFFGLTEITEPQWKLVSVLGVVPEPATLAPGFSAFETLEGMLVRITGGVAASGTDSFGAADLVAAAVRPFREPGLAWDGNPEILEVDTDALGGPAAEIVGGASITLAEGPLGYAFGTYEIWPLKLEYVNPPYPRAVRARRDHEITIASQNLHRLFASDTARLPAVSHHIRNVLGGPDVLAVEEVDTQATLQAVADRIRADDATIGYRAYLVEGNDPGGIDTGFLVRDRIAVQSVEAWAHDDTWIPPGETTPVKLHDRPPLVLRGAYAGLAFRVIAVHLRSLIDIETARTQAKRHEQALRLSRYIQSLQGTDPAIALAVIGDFNAFEFSDGYVDVLGQLTGALDPGGALVAGSDEVNPDLTNQVLRVPAAERYSFVFEGTAQVLDHALTSTLLTPLVRDVRFARANADAAQSMSPVSDHDGIVLYVAVSSARRRAVRH